MGLHDGLFIVTLLLLAWNGRWHFLQGVIFLAVLCSTIRWEWTPNMHLACYIGAGLAFGATALINWLTDLRRRHRPRRQEELTGEQESRSALTLRQKAL